MELGDLDLDGLEEACVDKILDSIPSQKFSLLGEAILKKKSLKHLGIVSESLRETEGKKKGRGEKWGRRSNLRRDRVCKPM